MTAQTEKATMNDILKELGDVLEARRQADAGSSYVASLYAGGTGRILEKVAEEAGEVAEAGRSGTDEELVHEVADLWFHTLVLLAHRGLPPDRVLEELARRAGRSGLDEKAGRLRE